MATGANTTPLGRLNPVISTGTKSSFGQSLLKPSYMSGNGNSSSVGGNAGGEGQVQLSAPFSSLFSVVAPPPPPPPPLPPISQIVATLDNSKRKPEDDDDQNEADYDSEAARRKRRKSRWGNTEKDRSFIPGMPTVIPSTLSKNQEKAYLLQLQIEELSRRLRTGDLGIPLNPEERSPSPEPIYNNEGKRLNTREYRTRKKLEDERHSLIQQMIDVNPEFKPPSDYKPPVVRVSDKVMIPQEEHPDINFVGLLIGPRGNTLKSMEKDTGAKIIIRGKGSVKEGKVSRKDGQPLPGEDEPLHAYVTANNPESVKKAVEKIKEIIRQGVEVPEGQNDLRRMQLRELALLNGTLRENDGPRCTNCGASNHKSWQCPDKPNITNNVICSSCGGAGHIAKDCRERRPGMSFTGMAPEKSKIDEEYMSLMAELGEGPPPPTKGGATGYMSSGGIFGSSAPARAIMAPPPPGSGSANAVSWSSNTGGKTTGGGYPQAWNQMNTTHNQYSGPPPPGIMTQPPPPPPGASPGPASQSTSSMGWMAQQGMPWPSPVPPPRSGAMVPPPWGANYFGVPPPPPPPPPGGQTGSVKPNMDISALTQTGLPSLLATPPPPPPT